MVGNNITLRSRSPRSRSTQNSSKLACKVPSTCVAKCGIKHHVEQSFNLLCLMLNTIYRPSSRDESLVNFASTHSVCKDSSLYNLFVTLCVLPLRLSERQCQLTPAGKCNMPEAVQLQHVGSTESCVFSKFERNLCNQFLRTR